jgi:hypothetical protein
MCSLGLNAPFVGFSIAVCLGVITIVADPSIGAQNLTMESNSTIAILHQETTYLKHHKLFTRTLKV